MRINSHSQLDHHTSTPLVNAARSQNVTSDTSGPWLQWFRSKLSLQPLSRFFEGAFTATAEATPATRWPLQAASVALLAAALNFYARGAVFVATDGEGGSGGGRSPAARGWFFHTIFGAMALVLAGVRLGLLWGLELPLPLPLPWLCLGRALAALLMALALGLATGARLSDTLPAAVLGAGAWLQLGVAAAASEPALHWGLFCSGAGSGMLAHAAVEAAREASKLGQEVKKSLQVPLDMAHFISSVSLFFWLVTEGFGRGNFNLPQVVSCTINGLLDIAWAVGCGHLLLHKREQVLDTVFRAQVDSSK